MLVACRVDPGFKAIDYDPKPLKVALRKAGNEVPQTCPQEDQSSCCF